jgi:4-hydroxybenzoate polyprenyltransferase
VEAADHFTLGVFAMRAAGCAINDYADRKLDPQVARTAGRPIASGRVTPREALIVFAALAGIRLLLVLFTNR